IDQDAPHHLSRDGEEVSPAPPIHLPLIDQAQEGFMDEVVRLESVALALAVEVAPGQPAQLAIDQRHELLQRAVVARSPGGEESSHALRVGLAHLSPSTDSILARVRWQERGFGRRVYPRGPFFWRADLPEFCLSSRQFRCGPRKFCLSPQQGRMGPRRGGPAPTRASPALIGAGAALTRALLALTGAVQPSLGRCQPLSGRCQPLSGRCWPSRSPHRRRPSPPSSLAPCPKPFGLAKQHCRVRRNETRSHSISR